MDFLQIRSLLLTFTSGRRHFFPMWAVVITATHLIYEVINFPRIFLFQKGQIALQFQQIHCLFMRQVLFCPQLILRRGWVLELSTNLFEGTLTLKINRQTALKKIANQSIRRLLMNFASTSQFHVYRVTDVCYILPLHDDHYYLLCLKTHTA